MHVGCFAADDVFLHGGLLADVDPLVLRTVCFTHGSVCVSRAALSTVLGAWSVRCVG